MSAQSGGSILRQPKAVWATAVAAVVAFMGIGLVDPILPSIAKGLDATPEPGLPAVHQLLPGHRRRHAGHRLRLQPDRRQADPAARPRPGRGLRRAVRHLRQRRLNWSASGPAGAWATPCSSPPPWPSSSARPAAAPAGDHPVRGRPRPRHLLRPAAGRRCSATGNWRAPFFGTAVADGRRLRRLIAAAAEGPPASPAGRSGSRDPIRALGHRRPADDRGHRRSSTTTRFFTDPGLHPLHPGHGRPTASAAVFFGWGVLPSRVFSVFVAPAPAEAVRLGQGAHRLPGAAVLDLRARPRLPGTDAGRRRLRRSCPGAPIGVNNTVYTELAMGVSDAPRPVASAGYNFVRWMGGALAPYIATKLGEDVRPRAAVPPRRALLPGGHGRPVRQPPPHAEPWPASTPAHAFQDAPVVA